jgi:hypothetical protein
MFYFTFFIFIRQVSFYFLQNDFNTALSGGGAGISCTWEKKYYKWEEKSGKMSKKGRNRKEKEEIGNKNVKEY